MTADDDEIIVSYSEIDTFRQCPLKHYLAYVMRYTKSARPGGALARGTLWHLVMQEHYKIIRDEQALWPKRRIPKEREKSLLIEIRQLIKWIWEGDDRGVQTDDQALIEWMYDGYIQEYGASREWRILGVEQQVRAPFLDENGKPTPYILKANIDLIIWSWETNSRWVEDHKSASQMPSYFKLDMADQFSLYAWLLKQNGTPVTGCLHSAARTTRNMGDYPDAEPKYKPQSLENRFRLTYVNRTDIELDNIALDAYNATMAAYPPPGMIRSRYSAPNPDQCEWKCDFKEVHIQARKGRDIHKLAAEFGFVINRERH